MARKPRIHVPGGVYHVILRGNSRQDIFFTDPDRDYFYHLLEEGTDRFGYRIHAFCLMTNHVHLLIQVGETPLSKIVHNLTSRYSRLFNKLRGRSGHLFQQRYKAVLVDTDAYLLELARYIHLNPIRSKLVSDPCRYRWSSYPAYMGRTRYLWLTTEWILGMFGQDLGTARRGFEEFIFDGMGQGYRPDFHGKGIKEERILGQDTFVSEVLKGLKEHMEEPIPVNELIDRVCEYYEVESSSLKSRKRGKRISEARALLALLARDTPSLSLAELGKLIKRDIATLSRAALRLEKRMKVNEDLAMRIREGKRETLRSARVQA